MVSFINTNKNNLLHELMNLRNEIDHFLFELEKGEHIDMTDASKQNLSAFLAVQKFANSTLHSSLVEEGFSSVKMMSPHVLYSLNKIISHLYSSMKVNEDYIDRENAVYVKDQRNQALLGKSTEEPASIMVTLDKTMLETPVLFKELLKSGMTIARINLARDYSVWKSLIENIRTAEKELGLERKTKKCKIYMDLPGPKIRVGDFKKISVPLKINTKKSTPIGYLLSRKSKDSVISNHFKINIDIDAFTNVTAGQMIPFMDSKGRNRYFKVLEKNSATVLRVELNQSAILNEDTTLDMGHDSKCKLTSLLKRQVTIKVKKDDNLRIYKSHHYLGKPKNSEESASIGMTIPDALKNVSLNDRVFFNDGNICAVVTEVNDHYLDVRITLTRKKKESIKPQQGVNFPDSLVHLNVPAITETDLKILSEIIPYVDLIGISFIHHPNDIRILKRYLEQYAERKIGIIAKIETKYALLSLSRIILEGLNLDLFGVMIARGDLTIEIGYEQLARAQEGILEICRAGHVPVIWATSVLHQLNKKGMPSRAELTDAFIGLRADCIMMNKGPYISDTVKFLQHFKQINKDSLLDDRNAVLSFAQTLVDF